jgi:acetolactate synthase I/II/III large subunit
LADNKKTKYESSAKLYLQEINIMKASDFIASFLKKKNVPVVFEMIGGMLTHLIDSLHLQGDIKIVSMHHEQAAGFAAEAVGRMTGTPGVALATSGPGATNLITAIGSCYFDSVPAVFITGQVNTDELSGEKEVRQQGFQETDIVSIVKPLTKGAWLVKDTSELQQILESAFALAIAGRPGPVLIDIPMNVQRMEMSTSGLSRKAPKATYTTHISPFVDNIVASLKNSRRPLILAGGGIRSALCVKQLRNLVNLLKIPVVQTLMGIDTLPYSDPHRVGMIGTYGNRWANKALMQSDFLLVLGSRLDVRQTGSDVEEFKGNREIYHIDCEKAQVNNRIKGCYSCVAQLSNFFDVLTNTSDMALMPNWDDWKKHITNEKAKALDVNELHSCIGINPNQFMHALSKSAASASAFLADVGNNQMWAAQSLELNDKQRFLSSGGMGSMGFALPAAIGCTIASQQTVVTIMGDGGLQCNIQELETISLHRLPIKIVVLNNQSLGMVRQFQEEYFESRLQSTVWGYSAPDFESVAKAYKINSKTIHSVDETEKGIKWLWADPKEPCLLQVMIDPKTKVLPKVAFGRPINDMDPSLD